MSYKFDGVSDEELYAIALEKRKNGNGTPKAYAAQREIQRRGTPRYAKGPTKKYAHNNDYMFFEEDNR